MSIFQGAPHVGSYAGDEAPAREPAGGTSAIDRSAFGGGFDAGALGEGPDEDMPDLSGMTCAELRALADERGIAVPSKANKATIIGLIEVGG